MLVKSENYLGPIENILLPSFRPDPGTPQGVSGQHHLPQHGGDLRSTAGRLHQERPLPVSFRETKWVGLEQALARARKPWLNYGPALYKPKARARFSVKPDKARFSVKPDKARFSVKPDKARYPKSEPIPALQVALHNYSTEMIRAGTCARHHSKAQARSCTRTII